MGDDSDEETRRRLREHRASLARERRRKRRIERERAYSDAKTTPSNVAAIPLRVPPGHLLIEHLNIASLLCKAVAGNATIPLVERAKVAISILPSLARAVDSADLYGRVEALEADQRKRVS